MIRTKGANRARKAGRAFPFQLLRGGILNLLLRLAGKSTTGFDTARLFLGSEGTLGVGASITVGRLLVKHLTVIPLRRQIITELTVRLAPVLPLKVALTSFPTVAQAVSTVVSILSAGMTPTSLELLDGTSIRGLNLAKLLPESLPEEPTVLMRFSNPDDKANFANLEIVRGFVRENGGRDLKVAKDEKENDDLWAARKVRPGVEDGFFLRGNS